MSVRELLQDQNPVSKAVACINEFTSVSDLKMNFVLFQLKCVMYQIVMGSQLKKR